MKHAIDGLDERPSLINTAEMNLVHLDGNRIRRSGRDHSFVQGKVPTLFAEMLQNEARQLYAKRTLGQIEEDPAIERDRFRRSTQARREPGTQDDRHAELRRAPERRVEQETRSESAPARKTLSLNRKKPDENARRGQPLHEIALSSILKRGR